MHEELLRLPSLPPFDPADPVESAIISSLAGSWPRRAVVKRPEPDLDDLFDAEKADYPESLIPFRDHDVFTGSTNRYGVGSWRGRGSPTTTRT